MSQAEIFNDTEVDTDPPLHDEAAPFTLRLSPSWVDSRDPMLSTPDLQARTQLVVRSVISSTPTPELLDALPLPMLAAEDNC
jgi:hypothetical protein